MNSLLSLAAMFALTTTFSFACESHKDEDACGAVDTCEWVDGKCALKPIDCSTRDVANCAEADNKCVLKPATEDSIEECVAAPAPPKDEAKK